MQNYMLTEAEYAELIEASKPVPYIIANGIAPISPAARVNEIWARIGRDRGFDPMTAHPADSDNRRQFRARPIPPTPATQGKKEG